MSGRRRSGPVAQRHDDAAVVDRAQLDPGRIGQREQLHRIAGGQHAECATGDAGFPGARSFILSPEAQESWLASSRGREYAHGVLGLT